MSQVETIIEAIKEIQADTTISKNIKTKLDETIKVLQEEKEESIKKDAAIHLLEEVTEDTNIPSYIRTQIWNVMSLLEMA